MLTVTARILSLGFWQGTIYLNKINKWLRHVILFSWRMMKKRCNKFQLGSNEQHADADISDLNYWHQLVKTSCICCSGSIVVLCFEVFLQNKARREDFCPRNLNDMHMVVDKLMAHSHLKYKGSYRKLPSPSQSLNSANRYILPSVFSLCFVIIYFYISEILLRFHFTCKWCATVSWTTEIFNLIIIIIIWCFAHWLWCCDIAT